MRNINIFTWYLLKRTKLQLIFLVANITSITNYLILRVAKKDGCCKSIINQQYIIYILSI